MERTRSNSKMSDQVKRKVNAPKKKEKVGRTETTISTGSTLLDLAIYGGIKHGGGIPGGILVEVFGPASAGKTVLLCEIAGGVQRQGGQVMFRDPEARLNKQFARLFDLDVDVVDYGIPDTVPEVFAPVRKWGPEPEGMVHGIFVDSLAALSTKLELDDEKGDKMGMRRAKEFSEELRKTCRVLTDKGYLMVCSNQIRQNIDSSGYGIKYDAPGGKAIGFYSSLRLRFMTPEKIRVKKTIKGVEHKKVIGVKTEVEVFKSSIWEQFQTAPLYIIYDYGIDDVRANLQYVKTTMNKKIYTTGETDLDKRMNSAIAIVEEEGLEQELKETTIGLWLDIMTQFQISRKTKHRT